MLTVRVGCVDYVRYIIHSRIVIFIEIFEDTQILIFSILWLKSHLFNLKMTGFLALFLCTCVVTGCRILKNHVLAKVMF